MFKKVLILTTATVLTIGAAAFAYEKGENDSTSNSISKISPITTTYQSTKNNSQKNMLDIMDNNGYSDMANAMRNGDYKTMSDLMKNLPDKDYQNMINIMKSNGYAGMANMMQNVGKEGMVQMHNAMGGMMGRSIQNQ